MDLIIRNAQLRHTEDTCDIAISAGKIVEIDAKISRKGQQEIDARGRLTTPTR